MRTSSTAPVPPKRRGEVKQICLALQGGGAHGAFTWGVLDRLLEEEDIEIVGISGTSAGAINAALVGTGLVKGGSTHAKELLEGFWTSLSKLSLTSHYQMPQVTPRTPLTSLLSPLIALGLGYFSRLLSPYDFNPSNYNPLSDLFKKYVDFESLRETDKIKLFVSATDCLTNRIKVFDNKDLCEEALLASTCLPMFHQAVKWEDTYLWDGGYMGNPILEPLIYNCHAHDLVIVQVTPIVRKTVPKKSNEIQHRINEVTFNSALMREIRTILSIQGLFREDRSARPNPYADVRLHTVHDEAFMSRLSGRTQVDVTLSFLLNLHERGRLAANTWLKTHKKDLGVKSSMDMSSWQFESSSSHALSWQNDTP